MSVVAWDGETIVAFALSTDCGNGVDSYSL